MFRFPTLELRDNSLVNRRVFLKTASFTAAAWTLAGCRHRPSSSVAGAQLPTVSTALRCSLPPVHVSANREIRTIVGLRPYRPSGFRVAAEKIADKLVVHNYGHGGGGITLSWGTAKLAVDEGAQGYIGRIAVLGCGAVGLATARLLQDAGFQVTIYAKDLPPNTTSNIAGGQWYPFSVFSPHHLTLEFNQQFDKAVQFAYMRYQTMQGARYSVRWMRNYSLQNEPFDEDGLRGRNGPLRGYIPEVRDLQPNEHPFTGFKFVRQFDTMMIEPPIYLKAMMDDFRIAGGEIVVRELHDLNEVQSLAPNLIFNCTGLGAKALFNDPELTPARGQLTFLLPQPEVDYAVLQSGLYMFPRTDGIALGGTFEEGNWSVIPDEATKQRILGSHKTFFDNMKPC